MGELRRRQMKWSKRFCPNGRDPMVPQYEAEQRIGALEGELSKYQNLVKIIPKLITMTDAELEDLAERWVIKERMDSINDPARCCYCGIVLTKETTSHDTVCINCRVVPSNGDSPSTDTGGGNMTMLDAAGQLRDPEVE
jgi:hypothetical protein